MYVPKAVVALVSFSKFNRDFDSYLRKLVKGRSYPYIKQRNFLRLSLLISDVTVLINSISRDGEKTPVNAIRICHG